MTHDRAEGWKEIRVGSVYTTTMSGEDLRAVQHSYVVDRTSVESLADRVWQEFRRRGGRQAKRVVVIGDGATWIWHQAGIMGPTAVQIVDWYHACSHVQVAAKALAERRPDAALWLTTQQTALWEGRIQEVLDALHAIAWMSQALAEQETYFVRNQSRMQYARYRDAGLQIGSGSIESACKRVIGARCKQAGMRWSPEGVTAIAALRAVYLSHRFDACFAACPPPARALLPHLPCQQLDAPDDGGYSRSWDHRCIIGVDSAAGARGSDAPKDDVCGGRQGLNPLARETNPCGLGRSLVASLVRCLL